MSFFSKDYKNYKFESRDNPKSVLFGKRIKWFQNYGTVVGFSDYFYSIKLDNGERRYLKEHDIVKSIVPLTEGLPAPKEVNIVVLDA